MSPEHEWTKRQTRTLVEDLQEYFDLELATTKAQLHDIFQIRYRVYCEEFGYEPLESFPDGQETDEFDAVSSHCLVTHKSTGRPAGCARLVHVDEASLMPMEKFCGDSMDEGTIRDFDGRRTSICEFSRLAVDGAFRRRAGERATRFGEINAIDFSQRELRTFSLLAVSTILAAFAMSEQIGRTNCFAMMEPFLPRLLKRSGLIVHLAGKETDYHGARAPYFFQTHETVGGMQGEMQEFYQAIRSSFGAPTAQAVSPLRSS
jgi:N-acyl amino acid synthase of PEP-CTERM/exosortase system